MADKYVKTSEVADEYFNGKGKAGSKEDYQFGNTGGGEPMGQEGKYPKGGRGVWKGTYKEEPERDSQARTQDGKFTYNSVEGKETKYPGRGKTVPPTLTGGKNGVYIDEKVAEEKGGESAKDFYADKDYVPFRAGDKVAFEGKVRTLVVDQFKIAQGYDEAAKVLESKTTKKFMEQATKSRGAGRYSKAEKEAAKESQNKENKGKAFGVAGGSDFGKERSADAIIENKEKELKESLKAFENAKKSLYDDVNNSKDLTDEEKKDIIDEFDSMSKEEIINVYMNEIFSPETKEKIKSEKKEYQKKLKDEKNSKDKSTKEFFKDGLGYKGKWSDNIEEGDAK